MRGGSRTTAVCVRHTIARAVWGDAPPGKVFEIRCSEITSEAPLGQKLPHENFCPSVLLLVPGWMTGTINAVWECRAGNETVNEKALNRKRGLHT